MSLVVGCVVLGGCAVGSLKSVPAADATLSSSQMSLREQAEILAQTSWDQVRDQSVSLAGIAVMLIDGRQKNSEGEPPSLAIGESAASIHLATLREIHPERDELIAALAEMALAKAAEADRFIAEANKLVMFTEGVVVPTAEDFRIVERTCAQLKRQRATFESVERQLAGEHARPDTGDLVTAITKLQERIERLDEISQHIAKRQTA